MSPNKENQTPALNENSAIYSYTLRRIEEAIETLQELSKIHINSDKITEYQEPIYLTLKNASDDRQTINLFSGYVLRKNNHEFVHVYRTGQKDSVSYHELMLEMDKTDHEIGITRIHAPRQVISSQDGLFEVKIKERSDPNTERIFKIQIDPYQQQSDIAVSLEKYNLNEKVYLEVSLPANSFAHLCFIPFKTIKK